ncbi:MAG: xanthine dehydrogenase family protein molybdopterin-binding subunit, partial [Sphingobacteriales bacterium]
YSTDHIVKNSAHAIIIKSTVSAGAISEIDASEAEKSPGVIKILTHKNAPELNIKGGIRGGGLLQDANILFHGQHIGVVIAETFEQARSAARLVRVKYNKTDGKTDFSKLKSNAVPSKEKDKADMRRGNPEATFDQGEVKIDAFYETPVEHHQPMEPHATIAVWEGDQLTLYNSAQIINGAQMAAAATLKIKPENVRIISTHIGGGFGSKGGQWGNKELVLSIVRECG